MTAWIFGDSFDFYASLGDALLGYWDSGSATGPASLTTSPNGRFTGSQAIIIGGAVAAIVTKSSGSNDAIHHIVFACYAGSTLSGTVLGPYFELFDGTNAQCSVVVRSDGALVLTSGGPGGSALATYTGAISAQNTWTAFEIEVVVNNTTGSIAVRKNGNTVNDFSATGLNTRAGSTNNYANKLTLGLNSASAPWNSQTLAAGFRVDDILWRSDPSSVPFVGDIRAYQQMPATTVSAQFSPSPSPYPATSTGGTTSVAIANNTARYTPFTAAVNGTLGTVTLNLVSGYTGNMKCALFVNNAGAVSTVITSATTITNPVTGANTFTFSSPPSLVKGTSYYLGFMSDTSSGAWQMTAGSGFGVSGTGVAYASFPSSTPLTSSGQGLTLSANITPSSNADYVNEAQEDGSTSYVYDSTVSQADLYGITALAATPISFVAVTTRGFMNKSDAGSRSGQLQVKSGATTVNTSALVLSTSFGWNWRTDQVDPNTSAAWTASGVNNLQIGPVVAA